MVNGKKVEDDLKPHAPRIETMTIPKEFIGAVIGPGGKIIQGMQEETGATSTIEYVLQHIFIFQVVQNLHKYLCKFMRKQYICN